MLGIVCTHTQIIVAVCSKVFGTALLCFFRKASTDFKELERKLSSSGHGEVRFGKHPVTLMQSLKFLVACSQQHP